MQRIVIPFLVALFLGPFAVAEDLWKDVRESHIRGDIPKSLEKILSMDEAKMSSSEITLKYFALGLLHFENFQFDRAEHWFLHHIKSKGSLSGYAHYYLGETYYSRKEWGPAKTHFQKALAAKVPRNYIYKARYHLAEIAFEKKQYRTARKHYRYVERKWRSTTQHPQVVNRLMQLEFARRQKSRGCYWARRMYSRYPTYEAVKLWTADLYNAEYKKGTKTRCSVSFDDRSKRVRRLQWEGMAEKAKIEIDRLDIDKLGLSQFFKDKLLAGYYLNQGFSAKALELLLPYRDEQKGNFDYNMQLSKAAMRSGNYYLAQNTYRRAIRYTRNARKKRKAQFRSAFLAYQTRDYDLAAQMFTQLTKSRRRSSLYRDSKWYLAWTKYMRQDYIGAINEFKYIEKKQKKSWRWRSSIAKDKIQYWMAQAERQLGQFDQAYSRFNRLATEKSEGYYNLMSDFRRHQVEQEAKLAGRAIKNLGKPNRQLAGLVGATVVPEALLPYPPMEKDEERQTDVKSQYEEDDSDYNESLKQVLEDEPSEFYHSLFKEEDDEKEEGEFVTYFQDPRLSSRFDRVRDLIRIGFNEAAKWELYEIERRSRNETYQKSLMGVYKEIGAYNRSSYVSEVYFGGQRRRYGIDGVKFLWEHAYPQTFKDQVTKASGEFAVPPEFIWSIIRAESFFKAKIESPVGARGLMQIMPNTGRQLYSLLGEQGFSVDELFKPEVNIRLGSKYLQRLMRMFNGQLPLAAAGYNAGPHRVENWLHHFGPLEMDQFIEHIPYMETRNYVKKVTRNFSLYNKIYRNNTVASVFLVQPIKPVLKGRDPIERESWERL